MKRSELEKYLGQNVRIKFTFPWVYYITGPLKKAPDLNKYYYLDGDNPIRFRCSHVKKIEVLKYGKR